MPYPTNPTPTQINERLGTDQIFEAFNDKAKNGIAIIKKACSNLGLDETQQRSQIAAFIIEHKANLKNSEVFDYVTSPGEENEAVLNMVTSEYSRQMIGQEFVPALRGFVQSLPLAGGEAQKIDRYVKAFAQEYARRNPTNFATADAAYTMAFSTIMLNTDAHSNQVAHKMTFDQFVRNNRGMNNGADFNKAFLKKIYSDIQKSELKLEPRAAESTFTLAPDRLKNDALFSNITQELGKKTPNLKDALAIEGAEVSVSNKKPWYSFLTGYKSTVTIKKGDTEVTLEVSKPGLFSKDKQPSAVVKAPPTKDDPLPQDRLYLAAQVVSKFAAPFVSKPVLPYLQKEMEIAVDTAHLNVAPIGKAFEQYAGQKGHGAELNFLKEVASLKEGIENGTPVGDLQVQAYGIQQRYLASHADFPVSVDDKVTEQIATKLEEITDLDKDALKNLFSEAEGEVLERIHSGPVQKFKQTDEFQQQKKSVSEATHLEKKIPGKETSQKQSVKQSL